MPKLPTERPKADPFVVDMTTVLLNLDGEPIKDDFEYSANDPRRTDPAWMTGLPDLTLGRAAWHALFFMAPEDQHISGEIRWARGSLAERIRNDSAAALETAELALIKRQIGKVYGVAVSMRALPLLNPNDKPGPIG